MVFTRSGLKTGGHVQFKKPLSVRRVLLFENDPADFAIGNFDLHYISNADIPPSCGILRNGTATHDYTDNPQRSQNCVAAHNGYFSNGAIISRSPQMNSVYDANTDIPNTTIIHERGSMFARVVDLLIFVTLITGLCLLFSSFDIAIHWSIMILSLGVVLVSVMFSYFDSEIPGRIPPSPFSPCQYRNESGHTFHLSYFMSLVNGLLCYTVLGYIFIWSETTLVDMRVPTV